MKHYYNMFKRGSFMQKSLCNIIITLMLFNNLCGLIPPAKAVAFSPIWPATDSVSYWITALDVYVGGSEHHGIDIYKGNNERQNIVAVADGIVEKTCNDCGHYNAKCSCGGSWGNYVLIKHTVSGVTYYSRYAHLTQNSITKTVNDTVAAGEIIGQMGSSGNSDGPHLHLEIYEGNRTGEKAAHTFDYYKNNTGLLSLHGGMGFSTALATKSNAYGKWILDNCKKNSNGVGYTYNSCAHPSINCGVCPDCGFVYDLDATKNTSVSGVYTITKDMNMKSKPYSNENGNTCDYVKAVKVGDKVNVEYSVVNYYGNT